MTKQQRKVSELALIAALPGAALPQVKRGRLQNKLNELFTTTIPLADKAAQQLTTGEKEEAIKAITSFGELTGWDRPKHIITLISFCLELIEQSEFDYPDRITGLLNDIVEYFERAGQTKQPCFVGGFQAVDKWLALVND